MKLKTMILTAMAAVSLAAAPMTVLAHDVVFDDSAHLVEKETPWEEIDDALWAVVIEHEVNVLIHTTDSLNGMSIKNYTDQWYELQGVSDDGIVLVVCEDSRDYYIQTSGSCISVFTDAGLDYIEEQIVPDMSAGNYEDAFITFADLCDEYLEQASTGKPYDRNNLPKEPFNVGMSLLIALGVGIAAGGIGLLFLFMNLKSVHQQSGAADYKKPNSFHLDTRRDIYLYKKVKREAKPENDNRSGGSGGKF